MKRPFPDHFIAYAASDVPHLLTIARHLGAFDSKMVLALSQIQVCADSGGCLPCGYCGLFKRYVQIMLRCVSSKLVSLVPAICV